MSDTLTREQIEELDALYAKATQGPVTVSGTRIGKDTDEETRHIAICGWDGEAKFYAALRNAWPTISLALRAVDGVVVPRAWVEVAVCPACDGSGGIPVQVGEQEWAQQQCQWCDEKKAALAAAPGVEGEKP